jgi:hypothetical protein
MNNPSGRTAPCASGEQRVVEARRPRGQYIYQPTSRRSAPRWPSTPPPEQQCARWVRCRGARTCPVSPCTARTRSAGPRIHEEDAPGAAAETEAAHGRVERHTVGSVEVHRGSVPPARRAARSRLDSIGLPAASPRSAETTNFDVNTSTVAMASS